jgi:hypothetical protein
MRTGNIVGNRMIQARELLNLLEDQHPIGEVDKDDFVDDFTHKVSKKSQVQIIGEYLPSSVAVRLTYKFPLIAGIKPEVDLHQTGQNFLKEYKSQFDIPIRRLESLCLRSFEKADYGRPGIDLLYTGVLPVPVRGYKNYTDEKDIMVCLFCTGLGVHQFLSIEVILSIFSLYPDHHEIHLSSDQLDKLIDATAGAFVGYKKLVNQFNNKPTKKTNTDW